MPAEAEKVYFVFSIPNQRGTTVGGLDHLIGEMQKAGVKLLSVSGFVFGQRTRLFCVPHDPDLFRAFAKKRKLRTREKTAIHLTGNNELVMNLLHRRAISGEILPASSISGQAGGFVYLPR